MAPSNQEDIAKSDLVENLEAGSVVGISVGNDGSVSLTTFDGRVLDAEPETAERIISALSPATVGGLVPGRVYIRRAGKVFGFEPVGEVNA